jgi:hypothetical protein
MELSPAFDALQVYLGGYYVNDFNRFGLWQVGIFLTPVFYFVVRWFTGRVKPESVPVRASKLHGSPGASMTD